MSQVSAEAQLEAVNTEAQAMRSIAKCLKINLEKLKTAAGRERVANYAQTVLDSLRAK